MNLRFLTGEITIIHRPPRWVGDTLVMQEPIRVYRPDPRHPLDETGQSYIEILGAPLSPSPESGE